MNPLRQIWITLLVALALLAALVAPVSAQGLTGSFYTTTYACQRGNVTQFAVADDVYLGSGNAKGSKLPDGSYYVRVTEPDGTLLGESASAPVAVTAGRMAACYKLWDSVVKASDGAQGFDTTANPGGVYKVWLSPDADFASAKTHNFKLAAYKLPLTPNGVQPDAGGNNGQGNGRDLPGATGWRMRLQNALDNVRGWFKDRIPRKAR